MTLAVLRLKPTALIVGAALAAFASQGALAQSEADDSLMKQVVVTGSSIKRIEGETALPVQVLKRADIERSGATSTEELVKQLSSLSSAGTSTTAATSSGYGGGSIATVSLRGLGSARTLVLVNGRRMSVYGGGSAGSAGSSVDINSIPLSAIDRVEVLKDGASAVYGSDAVAGVVNFILRKDYRGVEISASDGQPTRGGHGQDQKLSIFAGKGDFENDGYNLTAGLSTQKTSAIYGYERAYARRLDVGHMNDYTSSISFPANVTMLDKKNALGNPMLPNCGPVSEVSPYTSTRCSFDNSPSVSLQPSTERLSLLLNGRRKLTGDLEAYFETGYTENRILSTTQAVPMAYNAITTATNPYVPAYKALIGRYPGAAKYNYGIGGFVLVPGSPYYPTAWLTANDPAMLGLPLPLQYRDVANGVRQTRDTAQATRALGGVRGTLAGWDVDAGLMWSQSKVYEDLLAGYAQYSKVLPILNSGVINPFGDTTDATALQSVRNAEFRGTSYGSLTSTTSLDFKGTRELFQLPAGALAIAVGGEVRREKFSYNPSVAIQTGDIAGLGGNAFPVTGQRNVEGVYVEASVPIVKTLDGDVAVRYDHYQGVGSTTNPKASLRWQPTSAWLVRGSVGTGYRAPSLTDLYTPQATSITANGTRDPVRCPNIATGAPNDCNFQFTTVTGGNPNLKPEKSVSVTAGIMFEPTRDISFSVDGFKVNLKDAIVVGGLSSTYFLASTDRALQYAQYIQRGAPDGNASGAGPIVSILQTNANLFRTNVAGADIDGRWALRLPNANRLLLRLSGTWLGKYDTQGPDGSYTSALDQALNASGGVVLRWKHNASATWQMGPYEATLEQNYQKGYTDALASRAPAGSAPTKVDAYDTFDLQLAYNGFRNTHLAVGIKNLFDRDPPYTNLTSNFLGGYDVSYADPRGRFAYVNLTYSFK
ncbi:TonB-dependent receptor [Massilia sp. 9096]|uniref:TonB-dependent receptor n=1 Tax=Massilia sp. 9096 TaxID=1500894 RepID=UPI0009E01B97|nr:TonB-dependent receptor [Massilia sp. 9096]